MKKQIIYITLIIVASFFIIKPLFSYGFFPVHDNAQIVRVQQMVKSLSDGQFPVRIVPDMGFGYGYPVFNFYAPFAYYLGALFVVLLHLDIVVATKLMIATGVFIAGIGMYLFSRDYWGDEGGILSALLYMYAPYHALDIYVRGDIAESWAFAFIPWVLWAITRSYERQQGKYFIFGSLAYAGVILSHNLTAMMVTPFILLLLAILTIVNQKKPLINLLLPGSTILSGALVSAFYWLPVFLEMRFTDVASQLSGGFDYHNHFVCIQQLWYSPWGYGGSVPGCIDGLSFMLGKIHIAVIVIGAIALLVSWRNRKQFSALLIALLVLIASVFLTLPVSVFLWNSIHLMMYFQFPWRFLLITAFCMSFLGGVSIWLIQGRVSYSVRLLFLLILSVGCIFINMKFFLPQRILAYPTSYFISKEMSTWEVSKTASEYMPKDFLRPKTIKMVPSALAFSNKSISISVNKNSTVEKIFHLSAKKSDTLHINLAYFPSWHAYLDGKEIQIQSVNTGLNLSIPDGDHTLVLRLQQTLIEHVANLVSVIGICSLIVGIIYTRKKGKKKTTHAKENC